MTRRRITMNEVAEVSGTSPASVSLAMRNKPGVGRETRERILRTAQELGYQGSFRAGNPEATVHRNVALIFRTWSGNPEQTAPTVSPFYSSVLTGIQEAGVDSALNLLLGTIPVDSANVTRRLPISLLRQQLDGVLLVGSFSDEAVMQVIEACGQSRPAIVLVDGAHTVSGVDAVMSDNIGGGYEAAQHLIDAGHRAISWVGAPGINDLNFGLRFEGFAKALADNGLSPAVVNDSTDLDQWTQGIDNVLANSTASFCANDTTAITFMRECRRRDVRCPHDHSVIGFDDIIQAIETEPALTTLAVDKLSMGRVAVELLEYRMRYPDSALMAISLKPRTVSRSSVTTINTRK